MKSCEVELVNGQKLLNRHKCLLDKMKEDRIFSICLKNNKFYLNEQCDDYFFSSAYKERMFRIIGTFW